MTVERVFLLCRVQRFLTSPRVGGEVGSQRRCQPREGESPRVRVRGGRGSPSPQPSPREERGEEHNEFLPHPSSLVISSEAKQSIFVDPRIASAARSASGRRQG